VLLLLLLLLLLPPPPSTGDMAGLGSCSFEKKHKESVRNSNALQSQCSG
jgi:hypothetical protein